MSPRQIIKEINRYYSDSTRSQRDTLKGLTDIRDEVESNIESIKSDLDANGEEYDEFE